MIILLTPFLVLAIFILSIVLLACRKKVVGLTFLAILILINAWAQCFALHPFPHKEGELKAMCMNIHVAQDQEKAQAIIDIIKENDPDILCVSEFWKGKSEGIDTLLQNELGYRRDWSCHGLGYFSKFPISSVSHIGPRKSYGLSTAKIVFDNDTLCIALCHLASNNISAENNTRADIDSVRTSNELRNYIKNISLAGEKRKGQAEELNQNLTFAHPTIVLGDMNDLWGSGALRTFQKAGLNDAWWHAGFGYGSTIHHPLPFRIDHILYSPHLKVRTVKRIKTHGLSDHDGVVATFDVKMKTKIN
ncbi:MAG: endonuclease/exonuclease/phosphatase family protein [Bacteroidaceae bacterium]|nr:endonuclease/exonuclease/phosphatase family protein [Bacteroidaceae bacterium]